MGARRPPPDGDSLAKALVITEKPSVARDIAEALGGFAEHDGYWESDDYVVTFAVGHLFELLSPEEVDEKFKRWTLDVLPIIPERFEIKKKKGHSDRIRVIKKLAFRDDVDRIVNACDAGREGELIFREVVKFLEVAKPIERLWLQSMTTQAIKDGFGHLIPGAEMEGLAQAAECRAYSDWLIGMNATRAITKRLKSRKEKTSWSAGRVQTPTLALLVDKEFEVLAHVPETFYRITATFGHADTHYEGTWFDPDFQASDDDQRKDDRIFDAERAKEIVARVQGQPGAASETRKPSRESAPPLFDLTSLQREGNRRFGWSARRTLGAAQRCYEGHKILTYPRTDSKCLPEDYRATVDEGAREPGEPDERGDGRLRAGRAAAHRSGSRERGQDLQRRGRVRPLRRDPDRQLADARAHGRRQAPVRPGDAPIPGRLPSARSLGARGTHDRGLGRELPHAYARADGAGLALGPSGGRGRGTAATAAGARAR